MKVERCLEIHLTLTEDEANDLYIHYKPKYSPNNEAELKKRLRDSLGYEPKEAP